MASASPARRRATRITLLALVVLLALPAGVAWGACASRPMTIGPEGRINPIELSYPGTYIGTNEAWGLHESWLSVMPRLSEWHFVTGPKSQANAPRRDGSSIEIWRPWPGGKDTTYADDEDPATGPCEVAGKTKFQRPIVLVRETAKVVFITSITRYNTGSREGCITRTVVEGRCDSGISAYNVGLKAPVGDRNVILAGFE